MANFTYEIPEEYRSSFQGFVNPDQNKIYIGGPNSPIVNDDQARRLIMEVTGLDSNIVFTFAGGPQDLDFFLGVPLMNAVIKKDAETIDFYRVTGRTGDVSENYPDMDTTRFRRVPLASSFNPTIANIDQGLASFDLTDSGYKNTAKQNIENNRNAAIDDTKKDITEKTGKSSNWLDDAIAEYNKNANDWMMGGSAAEDGGNFWTVLGDSLAESGEAIKIEDLIANPQQFLQTLQGDDAKLIYTDESTGIQSLNPWVAMAMDIATEQSGYVNKQQLALLDNAGAFQIAKMNKDSQLAYAKEEGLSAKEVAQIRADADVEIAEIGEFNRQQEFNYLNQKEDLQFRLQQQAANNEYNLLMYQGEKSDKAADRLHAETMKQFDLQRQQFESQQQQSQQQHAEAMKQFENQLASGELLAALEREAREVEFNLRSADIDRQIKRDEIMAQTDKEIAEIQRLQAGDVAGIERQVALRLAERDEKLAELERATILGTGAQELQATLAGFEAQELQATETASAQRAAAESARLGQEAAATSAAGAQIAAAQSAAAAASPFGFLAQPLPEGLTPEQREALLLERQNQLAAIQQQQFNPFDLSTQQFQDLQALQARAGATPFGAITTAPTTEEQQAQTYTDLLNLQKAQAAQGPFQAAQLGQQMADISTIQRGGLTPQQQLDLAEAPGNPFGLTAQQQIDLQATLARGGNTAAQQQTLAESLARGGLSVEQQLALAGMQARGGITNEQSFINLQNQLARGGLSATEQSALAGLQARGGITDENEFMALQQSLARGGLTPTQRLAEVQAGAAPQNMANYLNFIGNPAAVGFAGQSGFLQNIADSPEGNIPASLFGLNVPQNTPAVPTNPTMADLTDLTDEQLGFYQGQMAAQNYQTPSQIFQQAQTVTPQGV